MVVILNVYRYLKDNMNKMRMKDVSMITREMRIKAICSVL